MPSESLEVFNGTDGLQNLTESVLVYLRTEISLKIWLLSVNSFKSQGSDFIMPWEGFSDG